MGHKKLQKELTFDLSFYSSLDLLSFLFGVFTSLKKKVPLDVAMQLND